MLIVVIKKLLLKAIINVKVEKLTLTENCDMDIDIVMVEDGNSHIITEDNIFNNDSSSNSIVVIPIADENPANLVKNDTCNDDWILINKCMEDPDGNATIDINTNKITQIIIDENGIIKDDTINLDDKNMNIDVDTSNEIEMKMNGTSLMKV